jgi:hypothetical protein
VRTGVVEVRQVGLLLSRKVVDGAQQQPESLARRVGAGRRGRPGGDPAVSWTATARWGPPPCAQVVRERGIAAGDPRRRISCQSCLALWHPAAQRSCR